MIYEYNKLLTQRSKNNRHMYVLKTICEAEGFKFKDADRKVNITLTLDGIEIDFMNLCQRVADGINQDAEFRAKLLIKDELRNKMNAVYASLDRLTNDIDYVIEKGLSIEFPGKEKYVD